MGRSSLLVRMRLHFGGRESESDRSTETRDSAEVNWAEVYVKLGAAYDRTGEHEESLDAFKQAAQLKPDDAEAQYLLGWAYSKAGHHKESIEPLKRAIGLKPNHALAHYHLGLAYKILGDKDAAFEEHRILTTLDAELARKLYDSLTGARLTDR